MKEVLHEDVGLQLGPEGEEIIIFEASPDRENSTLKAPRCEMYLPNRSMYYKSIGYYR